MRTKSKIVWFAIAGVMGIGLLSAAEPARRSRSGTYFSAEMKQAPLPYNPFPELPLVALGDGRFVYDDRDVDYARLHKATAISAPEDAQMLNEGPAAFGADLHIASVTADGESLHLSIANAVADTAYDVYYTPSLNPGSYWRLYFRGSVNQVEFDVSKPASPHGFFIVGSANDADGDGLTDGFEVLVTKTDPNDLDSDDNDIWDGPEDFDGDGAKNIDEFMLRTNPFRSDSDGDGLCDGANGGSDFATDAIDNDGDGQTDEADEASIAKGPDLFPTDLLLMGKLRGDSQVGVVSQQLNLPFVVYLTNPDGTPVANGQTVTFTARSPSNLDVSQLLSSTSDTTGNNGFVGQAQTRLTLGAEQGTYTVTAQWNGNLFTFSAETASVQEVTATDDRYQTIDPHEVVGIVAHYRAIVTGASLAKSHVLGMILSSEENPTGIVCPAYETAPGSGVYLGSVRTDALAPSPVQSAVIGEQSEFYKFRFPDGVMEYCSADSGTDWSDSDIFDDRMTSYGATERGRARHPNAPAPHFPLTDGFMRHAGRQPFHIVAYGTVNLIPSWGKNQADIFYFSGHGLHLDGALLLSNGRNITPESLAGGEWKEDLNMAIFAGCSVLDVTGHKWQNHSNPAERAARPGKKWMKAGPRYLLGYEGSAPADSGGVPQQVIDDFFAVWEVYFDTNGDGDPCNIWAIENLNHNANNACALDVKNNLVYHIVRRFGVLDVVEILTIP